MYGRILFYLCASQCDMALHACAKLHLSQDAKTMRRVSDTSGISSGVPLPVGQSEIRIWNWRTRRTTQ